MFNVGGGEIVVILLIALIVLGPDKLPSAARQAGKYLNEFRRMSAGFQSEFRSAMDVLPDVKSSTPAASTPAASTPAASTPAETAPTVSPPAASGNAAAPDSATGSSDPTPS